MIKRRNVKMIVGFVLIFIGMLLVFFNIPYSPIKSDFNSLVSKLVKKNIPVTDVFTEDDIAHLPGSVQKYFRYCGYIGTPKMTYMKASFENVNFSLGKDKPTIVIDYTQFNFVKTPDRIAFIDSSMYGIPFQGLDAYVDGKGSMKGVLAKTFTLFNVTGEVMDRSSLVTYLAEALIVPNVSLQKFITWEEIDDLHAKATITYKGVTGSGIFTFNEKGEMISFTTDDREATTVDGKSEKVRWSALCSDYREVNGIKYPNVLQGVWHYEDGDLIYFDGQNVKVEYFYK